MIEPNRREFLTAAGAALAVPGASRVAHRSAAKRRILVLGGTSYLGPEIVRPLLEAGHDVTLFNRGKTNPQLFPSATKLVGQRRRPEFGGRGAPQDLSALEQGEWDAVVDVAEFWTRNVEDMVAVLKGRVAHYVFVSTIGVYADLEKNANDIDEDSPVGTLDDRYTAKMDDATYGPLKAYCEQAVEAGFPGHATIVRPGYIIGPGDPYDRLTSRVVRIARGGDTLAPGDPGAELQMIDVRDLGAFTAKTAAEAIAGRFNATGYEAHVSVEEFHHAAKLALAHATSFEWVSDEFLIGEKLTPWVDIACWTPNAVRNHTRIERALAAGLRFRPVVETIQDTHRWAVAERGERPWRAGLKPEREAELLRAWRAR